MDPRTEERILREIAEARGAAAGSETEFGNARLDARAYVDPKAYEAELARLFPRTWLPIARLDELSAIGAFVTLDVGADRLAVVRAEAGDAGLCAFHDVCLHRGARVLRAERGRVERLRCPYHNSTYDLSGRLVSLPAQESFRPGFRPGEARMPPAAVDTWGGWAWVRADPDGPPLAAALGAEFVDELREWEFERVELVERQSFEAEFGWKVGVEAFLEAWHLASIHPRTAHPLVDSRACSMAWYGDHSRMINAFRMEHAYGEGGPLGREALAHDAPCFPRLNRLQRTSNFSCLVFPSTILNLLPNHFTMFRILPLAVDRVRFVSELYAAPPASAAAARYLESLKPGYAQLLAEDLENLPWIQRGLGDSACPGVELSWYERRIRHFRSRVEAYLTAS